MHHMLPAYGRSGEPQTPEVVAGKRFESEDGNRSGLDRRRALVLITCTAGAVIGLVRGYPQVRTNQWESRLISEMDRDEALSLNNPDGVLRRAGEDEEFRRLLMDNPKSAIARELGIDVPEGVHVTVLPESPNHVFVVLPSGPAHPQQPIVTGLERLVAAMGSPGDGSS